MSWKLLWLTGPVHYALRVFGGPNAQHRSFLGELVLTPAEAAELRRALVDGLTVATGFAPSETGWVDPAPAP